MRTSIVAWLGNRVMLRKLGLGVLAFVVMIGLISEGRAQAASVTLTPSVASPQMLGTPVTWTATVQSAPSGHTYDYQLAVTFNGQAQIVKTSAPPIPLPGCRTPSKGPTSSAWLCATPPLRRTSSLRLCPLISLCCPGSPLRWPQGSSIPPPILWSLCSAGRRARRAISCLFAFTRQPRRFR